MHQPTPVAHFAWAVMLDQSRARAGEVKPPRVLRAERAALVQRLVGDIVDGERFGAQVARLCDAFSTAQKKMIAGAGSGVRVMRVFRLWMTALSAADPGHNLSLASACA